MRTQCIENMRAPIGMEQYNFDNGAYHRAVRANRPSDAANAARNVCAQAVPAVPELHRTGF